MSYLRGNVFSGQLFFGFWPERICLPIVDPLVLSVLRLIGFGQMARDAKNTGNPDNRIGKYGISMNRKPTLKNGGAKFPTSSSGSDLDIDLLVSYNLKRVYGIFRDDFRDTLAETGPSPRAFAALSLVVQIPNITQSQVARQLGIERSGIVAIIDELEIAGLLTRSTVDNDKRVYALLPTSAGKKAYSKALESVQKRERNLLSVLESTEKKQIQGILKKLRVHEARVTAG